jgi:hypothetical protein
MIWLVSQPNRLLFVSSQRHHRYGWHADSLLHPHLDRALGTGAIDHRVFDSKSHLRPTDRRASTLTKRAMVN